MTLLTKELADALVAESPIGSTLTGSGRIVVIPDFYTSIDEGAFFDQGLLSVSIPSSVETIGPAAFFANNIENVEFSENLTTIGNFAFASNNLKNITLPDGITSIGEDAFNSNPIQSVFISPTFDQSVLANVFNQNVSLIVESSPTDIILSKGLTFDSLTAIDENIESSSTIGKLFTLDATPGDTFTYSLQLVEGDGDSDNSSFALDGNQLKILESPDFESQEVYSLNIRTTDSEGFSFEKSLTLKVNDLVEVEPRSQDAAISKYETAYKRDTKPGKEVSDKFKFNGVDENNACFTINNSINDELFSSGVDYSIALVQRSQTLDEAFASGKYLLSESFVLDDSTVNYISFDNDAIAEFKSGDKVKQKYEAIVFNEDEQRAASVLNIKKINKVTSAKFDLKLSAIIEESNNNSDAQSGESSPTGIDPITVESDPLIGEVNLIDMQDKDDGSASSNPLYLASEASFYAPIAEDSLAPLTDNGLVPIIATGSLPEPTNDFMSDLSPMGETGDSPHLIVKTPSPDFL